MEPITLTAAAIATVFFSEAVKEGGKSLGTGVSKAVSQLIAVVHNKFKAAGTAGLLARAEKQPTEGNVNLVKAELAAQLEEDAGFAEQLKNLLAQLEAADMSQKTSRGSSVEQEMLTDVKAQNIKLGNLSQES